jgi:thiol-disulfide isomerase/thioredoxin
LLGLPGNTLELTGTQLDGKPLDWDSYRGKTVLVVFCASWCGPCVAELPVLKDVYAKYHDRDFEVVAVSLDEERRRLEDFVQREGVKWPVLFGNEKSGAGWNHPLAQHYGVMRLPRSILVNTKGKVVSIDAHGEPLWDLLAKEIGPAVVKEKEPAAEGDKPATPAPLEIKPAGKPGPR